MDKLFSDYRINKNVSRAGVDKLIKQFKGRIFENAILSYTPIGTNEVLEDWGISKDKNNKVTFTSLITGKKRMKANILNLLSNYPVVGFVLICNTKQKYKKEAIKELWGYRLIRHIKKTILEEVDHEELYKYCTTDFSSGKSIPPQEEVVYCGPKGKICGWDMV